MTAIAPSPAGTGSRAVIGALPTGAALREALRRRTVPPEQLVLAGRRIAASPATAVPLRVTILGQCTTAWLAPVLVAEAWGRGAAVAATSGEYDNVIQELARDGTTHDVVVLVPWNRRLLGPDERPVAQRVADEVALWRQAWELAARQGARLVQVGYDWVVPDAGGYHLSSRGGGAVERVRAVNAALRAELPAGTYFVDLEAVAGEQGRGRFYEPRSDNWTRQPFSPTGLAWLGRHVWAGVRAVTTGPKKVLVLDLDNTLWGGVVGETGPLGIQLGDSPEGEAFRGFQTYCRALARRGVVLAVCSKNNPADASEPFAKNPDMVLRRKDFAAFEASWEPKSVGLARIAATLRLGLDAFVFFDDSPTEREQVRQALPQVEVVDVPADPAEYVRSLASGLWFEAALLTAEDTQRSAQYQVESQRQQASQAAGSVDEYLASLEMQSDVRPIDEGDLQRVAQLIGKTNQFNLTTRRHTGEDVRRMLAQEGSVGLTLRLRDRFGDYGLISVALGTPVPAAEPTLRIDTWLMSCRAIGRTVEAHFMNCIAEAARARGYAVLIGEFIASEKNQQVADLYERFGFARRPDEGDGVARFRLPLADWAARPTHVRPAAGRATDSGNAVEGAA